MQILEGAANTIHTLAGGRLMDSISLRIEGFVGIKVSSVLKKTSSILKIEHAFSFIVIWSVSFPLSTDIPEAFS